MKKLLTTLLTATAVAGSLFALTSCEAKTYELALVTDVGDIDDESFNQTSWEALKDYAEEKKLSYSYYRPTADSTDARVKSIEQSIKKGAKIVVCPGYLFEQAIFNVQDKYPDVKFVLLDGTPHNGDYNHKTSKNVVSIIYQEQISGFAAGYAAVKDGYKKLGFVGGMAVPAVQRFGSGYIQGAEQAAKEMKLTGAELQYYYAGAFQKTDEATATAKGWYAAGTEVVFACGGKVYQSVQDACENNTSRKWIGVDVDQHAVDKDRVITSAFKGLRNSVQSALEIYSTNTWDTIGGKVFNLGLNSKLGSVEAKDYVGLPTADASWGFKTFTKANYEELLNKIKDGTYTISDSTTAAPKADTIKVTYVSEFAPKAEEK